MYLLQGIRCALFLHRWGPATGDVAGAHHECSYCGRVRPLDTGRPPEAHDKLALHW
jgi:hypothetical protein